jgi:hypothetical protein
MATVNDVVAAYRQLRDKKKEIEDRQKEELVPLNERMEKLEAWLQRTLLEMGVDSMKTPDGTAYLSKTSSVKIEDWTTTLSYIVENEMWHVLEKRLAKSAVELFVEENEENLPGTSISFITKVNVRK